MSADMNVEIVELPAIPITNIVHRFIDERAEKKKKTYHQMLQVAFSSLMMAVLCLIARYSFKYYVLFFLFACLKTVGLLALSICPLDELDVDDFIASHPRFSKIVFVLVISSFIAAGLSIFPHTATLAALPLFRIIFGGASVHVHHNPRATSLCSASLIINLYAYATVWFFRGLDDPRSTAVTICYPRPMCFINAALAIILTTFLVRRCWWGIRSCQSTSLFVRYPTLRCYEVLYGYMLITGMLMMCIGCSLLTSHSGITFEYACWEVSNGIVIFLPAIVVMIFGREAVFGYMARRFDRSNAARDGEFLAELFMRKVEVFPGDPYWLHSDQLQRSININGPIEEYPSRMLNPLFPPGDERSEWWEGIVTEIDPNEEKITVKLKQCPNVKASLRLKSQTAESIYEVLGTNEPRYIEWHNLCYENIISFGSDVCDFYELSRPLEKGKRIDFFVSHSWRDHAMSKWKALVNIAHEFKETRGRYPTFWMDKFCLRQNDGDTTSALRALCVYIMACDQMIVLCGKTFPSRLWCAWELFTLFAFQREDLILSKLKLMLLEDVDRVDTTPVMCKALECLTEFNVANATCYSPFDRSRLMKIIDAIGRRDFDNKVRKMASMLMELKYRRPVDIYVNDRLMTHVCGDPEISITGGQIFSTTEKS